MNLFIQFIGTQMLKNHDVQVERLDLNVLKRSFSTILRVCELLNLDKLVVPTISIAEAPLFPTLSATGEFKFLLRHSRVIFSGSAQSADSWVTNKQRHYVKSGLYAVYFEKELTRQLSQYEPFFQKRLRSSTREVARGWVNILEQALGDDPSELKIVTFIRDAISDVRAFRQLSAQDRLLMAPHKLEGQALVWEILKAQNIIGIKDEYYDQIEESFQSLLSYIWIDSHCSEYEAKIMINLPYLGRMDCGYALDVPESCIDFAAAASGITSFGLIHLIPGMPIDEFATLARSTQWARFSERTNILLGETVLDGHVREAVVRLLKESFADLTTGYSLKRSLDCFDKACEWLESGRISNYRALGGIRMASNDSRIRSVVLATANKRETTAILELLKSWPGATQPIFVGRDTRVPRWDSILTTGAGTVKVSITQADETGGDEAVDVLRRAVPELEPDAVFFVGCAALLDEKEKHRDNTVYLARGGIDSDKGALKSGKAEYDMEQHPGDARIRRILSNMNGGNVFAPVNLVTNRDFISGSVFLADRNAERRRDLVTRFPPDAVVLEMEAFHVYKELFRMRTEGWLGSISIIKGISDFGDENAHVDKDESQRVATRNATTVVLKLLAEIGG